MNKDGSGHERSYNSKAYEFGDPFRLDLNQTIRNALRRQGSGTPVRLTGTEAALLKLLGSNARTLLSRAGIAQGMADTGASLAERSVDVHIARLRRKIEPDPRNPRYLKTVWGEGYVLWPD